MEFYEQKLWEIMGTNMSQLFKHLIKTSWEVDFKGAMGGFADKLEREFGHIKLAICEFASRYKLKLREFYRGDYNLYFDYHDRTGIYILAISRERGEMVPEECEYWRA